MRPTFTAKPDGLPVLLLIQLIVIGQSGWAATILVSDSIQRAVNQAKAGDTILVNGPTEFHETILIDKSVRLLGTNEPVVSGTGTGSVITVQVPDVTVSGLIIRNSGKDLTTYDSGLMLLSPRCTVATCQIETDAFGIYLRAASECSIKENVISGNKDFPSAKRGNGIHLWKTKGNQLLNNRIHDKRDGMYFSFADSNTVAGNVISDTRFGIHYMYSHYNKLLSNSLHRNAVGATLMFSRQSLIEGNVVSANRRHGMLFKQLDNSRIVGNQVSGHNRGFFVQQAVQNRFERNLIATNDIGLYLSNCSEQNVFVGNTFVNNTDQVWQPPDEAERGRLASNLFCESRLGNYWSDYTGNDAQGDGIGDTPYHETDVVGFIMDRHPEARIFAMSPAVALLRKGEELLPLLDTAGVTDPYPLMRPPNVRFITNRTARLSAVQTRAASDP